MYLYSIYYKHIRSDRSDRKVVLSRRQYHTIVIMYKLWSNDRFGFKVEKTHYYLFFCRKETFNNNFYLSL